MPAPPQLRPPPPEPAPAPAPPSVPRLELTHRRHLLCLGAGDSRGQDPGEETLAQHLPSCKRCSEGLQQLLQQGPSPPGAGRAPTRDQRPRTTPCTAGDTPEMESLERRPRTGPRGAAPPARQAVVSSSLSRTPGRGFHLSSGLRSFGAWGPPARRRCGRIPPAAHPLTRERLACRRRGS